MGKYTRPRSENQGMSLRAPCHYRAICLTLGEFSGMFCHAIRADHVCSDTFGDGCLVCSHRSCAGRIVLCRIRGVWRHPLRIFQPALSSDRRQVISSLRRTACGVRQVLRDLLRVSLRHGCVPLCVESHSRGTAGEDVPSRCGCPDAPRCRARGDRHSRIIERPACGDRSVVRHTPPLPRHSGGRRRGQPVVDKTEFIFDPIRERTYRCLKNRGN